MSPQDPREGPDALADPARIFTPAVEAMQARLGSRAAMAQLAESRGFRRLIEPDLAGFLASRDSVYLATASAKGQPYIQHRGGAPGFIRIVDQSRFAFKEQRGNRQYLSFANLSENPRAHLFAMDYPTRQRIKIWGQARMIERQEDAGADSDVWAALEEDAERALVFTVEAWDVNCPQYITPRFTAEQVAIATRKLQQEIAAQAAEIERLRAVISAQAAR